MSKHLVLYVIDDCIGCKVMEKHLMQLPNKGYTLNIHRTNTSGVNLDNSVKCYNVTDFPTLIKFEDNKEISRMIGSCTIDELKGFIS